MTEAKGSDNGIGSETAVSEIVDSPDEEGVPPPSNQVQPDESTSAQGDKRVARATFFAAVLATLAGILSTYVSYYLASTTNLIARDELNQNAAHGLLELAIQADTQFDNEIRRCIAVAAISEVEKQSNLGNGYLLVQTYFDQLVGRGIWPPECRILQESLSGKPTGPSKAQVSPNINDPDPPFDIGEWHALIASYDVTPRGCDFARKDITYFAEALAGQGFDGQKIYVARTSISNNYAVTIDAGDSRSLANSISTTIREVAESGDGPAGSGRDSFVQGNRNWLIDPDCLEFARVGQR